MSTVNVPNKVEGDLFTSDESNEIIRAIRASVEKEAGKGLIPLTLLAVLQQTSGVNSGDETDQSIRMKIGAASGTNDGYMTIAMYTRLMSSPSAADLNGKASTADLALKADKTELLLKADVSALQAKADKTTVDGKADLSLLANYATLTQLNLKADQSSVDSKASLTDLNQKANLADLNLKADKTEITNLATKSSVALKADLSELDKYVLKSGQGDYATITQLSLKADKSEVAMKADKSELTAKADVTALNTKADLVGGYVPENQLDLKLSTTEFSRANDTGIRTLNKSWLDPYIRFIAGSVDPGEGNDLNPYSYELIVADSNAHFEVTTPGMKKAIITADSTISALATLQGYFGRVILVLDDEGGHTVDLSPGNTAKTSIPDNTFPRAITECTWWKDDVHVYWDFYVRSEGIEPTSIPVFSIDDFANTLEVIHVLPESEILFSENNGPWVAYPGKINYGAVDRPEGYWRAKIRGATDRIESKVSYSPAVFAAPGGFPLQFPIYLVDPKNQ